MTKELTFDQRIQQQESPAEPGVWLFIFLDMTTFSLFFWIFIWERSNQISLFTQSQAALNKNLGVINTLLLLASSYCMVMALRAARKQSALLFGRFTKLAILCGFGFLIIKLIEYN